MYKRQLEKHPSLVPIGAFCYSAFIPLSDDILMMPAGLMKYPFWRLMLGVFPGKVAFNTLLAFSGVYGWDLLTTIYT